MSSNEGSKCCAHKQDDATHAGLRQQTSPVTKLRHSSCLCGAVKLDFSDVIIKSVRATCTPSPTCHHPAPTPSTNDHAVPLPLHRRPQNQRLTLRSLSARARHRHHLFHFAQDIRKESRQREYHDELLLQRVWKHDVPHF